MLFQTVQHNERMEARMTQWARRTVLRLDATPAQLATAWCILRNRPMPGYLDRSRFNQAAGAAA